MADMFIKCKKCNSIHVKKKFRMDYHVCPKCGYHDTISYTQRIELVADKKSFKEINAEMGYRDSIGFPGYKTKYLTAREQTNVNEAVVTGEAKIDGIAVMMGIMESGFMMGSMGAVVGEKITLLFEMASVKKMPVVLFCASGGARMQEGNISLLQMAKTSSAAAKFREHGGLYISVLTHPTTGGVAASFAFQGSFVLAEPNALVGFAGKRVIEQAAIKPLPKEVQTAEHLFENGFLDAIIPRCEMKKNISFLLRVHQ